MYFDNIPINLIILLPSYIEIFINIHPLQDFPMLIDNHHKITKYVHRHWLQFLISHKKYIKLLHELSFLYIDRPLFCSKFLLQLVKSITSGEFINSLVDFSQTCYSLLLGLYKFLVIGMDRIGFFDDFSEEHFISCNFKCRLFDLIGSFFLFFKIIFLAYLLNFLMFFCQFNQQSLCFICIEHVICVDLEKGEIFLNDIPISLILLVFFIFGLELLVEKLMDLHN